MRHIISLITKIALLSVLALMPLATLSRGCTCYFNLSHNDSKCLHYGDEGTDTTLLVIQDEEGRYGYCDRMGKIVIQPKYDDAYPFCDGYAAICRNKSWGYIDTSGKVVIPIRYWDATYFHNGKAFVSPGLAHTGSEIDSLRCNLIDKKGKVIKKTKYYFVWYHDSIYECSNDESVQYLNSDYNLLVDKKNSYEYGYGLFSEGLAPYVDADNRAYFIDKAGNIALDTGFMDALPFSEGLAAVCNYDTKTSSAKKIWAYIDKSGNRITEDTYFEVSDFKEGLACVRTMHGDWAIIDAKGTRVASLPDTVHATGSFSEGLCPVGYYGPNGYENDGHWGYADKTGKLVIDYKYEMATPFIDGIAEVLVNNRIAYIDKTGKYIWGPK